MNHPKIYWSLVFMATLAFAAVSVSAQSPGSLDPTFGSGGVSTTYVATTNNNLLIEPAIAVQSDGKFLTLADAHLNGGNTFTNVVIRYNPDGTLDSGFASGGFLYLDWHGNNGSFANVYAIAIQNLNGVEKVIVAGSGDGLRVERYNPDGSPDTTFGTNGRATFINGGYALAVTVQPDGKILTIGDVAVLARLTANGALDATFGSGGIVQSPVKARTLGLQSNGKIVTCGSSASGKAAEYVVRFNTNGSLDNGSPSDSTPGDVFGSAGKASGAPCLRLKVDASGRILAGGGAIQAGATRKVSYSDFVVTRLAVNGQIDSSFGVGGTRQVDFAGFSDTFWAMDIQTNGQIVLVGEVGTGSTSANGNDTGIARLNPNGSIDTTFGQNGRATLNLATATEYTRAAAIQFDPACVCEKLVTTSTAEIGGIDYAIAARFRL